MGPEHRQHADVGDGDHVGVTAPVAEQGELAEHVARSEPADLAAVVLDPDVALVQDEEPVPG